MITAIVLAAGESKRMGIPKALLKVGGKSFIHHVVDVLKSSNIGEIVVVVGAFEETIRKELEGLDVTIAFNRHYQRGQLSSLLEGIEVAQTFSPEGILIHPVDHPLISAELVNSLIGTFDEGNALIVVPTFDGKRGHPVLFSSLLFDELRNAPPSLGARAVVWQHPDERLEVITQEKGCILDIDTREDYECIQRENRTKGRYEAIHH